jgi:hypothetical protein
MTRKDWVHLLLSNLAIGCCFFNLFVPVHLFIMAGVVTALIYVIPGLAWVGAWKDHINDKAAIVFTCLLISTGIHIFILTSMFFLPVSINIVIYLLALTVIVNIGFIVMKPVKPVPCEWAKKDLIRLGLALILIYTCIWTGMSRIPPRRDLDGEHQCSVYGLIHRLKPYCTSDIVPSAYYFAHPTLTNFYNALSAFFLGKAEHFRPYYMTAIQTETLLHAKPNDVIPFAGRGKRINFKRLDDQSFVMMDHDGHDFFLTKQELIEMIYRLDHDFFKKNELFMVVRISNIMAALFSYLILYLLILHLTQSKRLAFWAGFVFLLSPGVFIRSSFSETHRFHGLFLVITRLPVYSSASFPSVSHWGCLSLYARCFRWVN